jgi:hypothetical protein
MHSSAFAVAGSFISCQPDSLCQRCSRWEFHSPFPCAALEGEIQFVKADFASAVSHMKYRRSFKTLKRLFHILVVLYCGEMKWGCKLLFAMTLYTSRNRGGFFILAKYTLIFNYDKTTAFPNHLILSK